MTYSGLSLAFVLSQVPETPSNNVQQASSHPKHLYNSFLCLNCLRLKGLCLDSHKFISRQVPPHKDENLRTLEGPEVLQSA